MPIHDYSSYDGLGLAELVRRREVSASELVAAAIERVERHNPALNAVVHTAFELARALAARASLGRAAADRSRAFPCC